MDYPLGRAITGEDGTGKIRDAHVHERDGHQGLLTYTRRDLQFNPEFRPFVNPTNGNAMNQDVGFTGFPTVVTAGVNAGSLLTGLADGTTANHLIDAGTDFTTNIAVGMSVKNLTSGTEYALVTAVANGDLTLDADILVSGEAYRINPIWTASAVAGAWSFSAGKLLITSAFDNDELSFDNDTNEQWDINNGFKALTGKVDLDTYDPLANSILLNFDLNGVQVGDQLDLNDFIDTTDFAEQSFVIPVGDFNFASDRINGATIIITRSGGTKPTIKFDDFQWEEIGESLVYTVAPIGVERFHVTELRFGLADNETGIVTVTGATENHSMVNLGYDKLLSVSALSNGIVFRRVQNTETLFSVTLRQLGDFLSTGSNLVNVISDGTNTFFTLVVEFPEAIILDAATKDFLSLTINDDLSSLLQFTAAARGAVEI